MLNVHYTWIGPPDRSEHQRDVGGALALMRATYEDRCEPFVIDFWCLDAHVDHFRQKFSGSNFPVRNRQKLQVRGIEHYLEERTGVRRRGFHHRSSALAQVGNWLWSHVSWNLDLVVSTIMAQSSRRGASVREIVNGKNTWSMYVMYRLGGYAMDTGVGPYQGRVRLVSFDRFKAPRDQGTFYTYTNIPHRYLRSLRAAVTPPIANHFGVPTEFQTGPRMDVWTMFAPAGNAVLLHGLEWYVRFWYLLEERRQTNGIDEAYKELCRNGIISAVMTAICFGAGRRTMGNVSEMNQDTWDDATLEGNGAGIPSLRLSKTYYGSHH